MIAGADTMGLTYPLRYSVRKIKREYNKQRILNLVKTKSLPCQRFHLLLGVRLMTVWEANCDFKDPTSLRKLAACYRWLDELSHIETL